MLPIDCMLEFYVKSGQEAAPRSLASKRLECRRISAKIAMWRYNARSSSYNDSVSCHGQLIPAWILMVALKNIFLWNLEKWCFHSTFLPLVGRLHFEISLFKRLFNSKNLDFIAIGTTEHFAPSPATYLVLNSFSSAMRLHQREVALLVPDDSLLHIALAKINIWWEILVIIHQG